MRRKIIQSLITCFIIFFFLFLPKTHVKAASLVEENEENAIINVDDISNVEDLLLELHIQNPDESIIVYTYSKWKPDLVLDDGTEIFFDPFNINEDDAIYITTDIRKKLTGNYVYYIDVYSLKGN